MEARLYRAAFCAALLIPACCAVAEAGSFRTRHFLVTAPTPELAREIAESAERYRQELAVAWLGRELPEWLDACPITAQVSPNLGAGGMTQFYFDRGRPHGWSMSIQGSRERVLDSVLPHEVTHMIFATHFGRPLPRWADEGACTTVEDASERSKQERLLVQFLTTDRGIAFNKMFQMTEYPADVLPLYSQGYSLARFLIANGGRRRFIDYIGDGMSSRNWTASTRKHYGFDSLSELQVHWLEWVRAGSRDADAVAFVPKSPTQLIALTNGRADAAPSADNLAPVPPAAPPLVPMTTTEAVAEARIPTPPAGAAESWYLRQRDTYRESNNRATARPQPPEKARQVILEWSRN